MAHERVMARRVGEPRRGQARVERLPLKPGGAYAAYLIKGAVVILAALLAIFLHWGAGVAFMLALLAIAAFSPTVSCLSVWAALLTFAICPLLIVAFQHAWLQQSPLVNYYAANLGLYTLNNAVETITPWAFYLLGIGLIGRTVSYARNEKRFDEIRYGTE